MNDGSVLMSPDDFIGEVIGIIRLDAFQILINHEAERDTDSRVAAMAYGGVPLPAGGYEVKSFVANGATMGQALAACREKIREVTGR